MTAQELLNSLTSEEGYTVQELADFLGCSRAYLYQVRNGKEKGLSIAYDLQDLLDGKVDIEDTSEAPAKAARPAQNTAQAEEPVPSGFSWGSAGIGAIIGGIVIGVLTSFRQAS
jgi:predicted transcriptional regulator